MAARVQITYKEFMAVVHQEIRKQAVPDPRLTPATIHLLGLLKPRLLKNALEKHDPNQAPYPLKEFFSFLEENWLNYERQEKEFSHERPRRV